MPGIAFKEGSMEKAITIDELRNLINNLTDGVMLSVSLENDGKEDEDGGETGNEWAV
jgi:hypothetical protein